MQIIDIIKKQESSMISRIPVNITFGSNKKENHKDKSPIKGALNLGMAGTSGYYGVRSGVPRLLGIRLERHYTSKEIAKNIIKDGHILDPAYGGTGACKVVNNPKYTELCKGHVHITGLHKDTPFLTDASKRKIIITRLTTPVKRMRQGILYKGFISGNIDIEKHAATKTTKMQHTKLVWDIFKNSFKGKTFFIPGTDAFFNKHFTPDEFDIALKTTKKLKVYPNRFAATIAGLKEFGFKGMKGNPVRVIVGTTILGLGTILSILFTRNGIAHLSGKNN